MTTKDITRRDHYIAENPMAGTVQDAQVKHICKLISRYVRDVKGSIAGMVDSAELARQIGIAIIEFEDTLPGKRLTEDFWRGDGGRFRQIFKTVSGFSIEREQLEWFAMVARRYKYPITNILDVLPIQKQLLLATGEDEFQLIGQREAQNKKAAIDEWGEITEWVEGLDIFSKWKAARMNAHYFPNGHLRSDLKETWSEHWKPKLEDLDRFREDIRRELGV